MDAIAVKLKHSDVLYDYIKFHLGLYLATPPVLAIVALALEVSKHAYFQKGMVCLVGFYFVAGTSAALTLASHVNVDWASETKWVELGAKASSGWRRFLHHYLYWAGLLAAVGGMVAAWTQGPMSGTQ
jgi:hypothetical protein